MIFVYKAVDQGGTRQEGKITSVSLDNAISSLQRRGLLITDIHPVDEKNALNIFFGSLLSRVSQKDLLIFTQQVGTLFGSQVQALKAFKLVASETENAYLRDALTRIVDKIQAGSSISSALTDEKNIFSPFYINMIKAGEESGHIAEAFTFLAEYLDRTYAINSKVRNALVYPAFIVFTFIAVMGLMFTVVIPKIGAIIEASGQAVPIYTSIIINTGKFLSMFGLYILIAIVALAVVLWRWSKTDKGKRFFDDLKIQIPYIGILYKKLYLSRIADNLATMIASGIPMIRALEITSDVVGHDLYKQALLESVASVKSGTALSTTMAGVTLFPSIFSQMVKIGEETGELGNILKTTADFYKREVVNAVDTIVSLIEPVMIVFLGVSVGFLLVSVLVPIYNISSSAGL